MPSIEDLTTRRAIATAPFDATDVRKFGELSEVSKDVFRTELGIYFDYKTDDAGTKLIEASNIQKFALGASTSEQSLETVVSLLMGYGDSPDQFPMIIISSTSEREKPLSIGGNFVGHFQYPPRVEGTVAGPYNLTDGWTLEITTWPLGTVDSAVVSTITFATVLFSDITNASIADVVNAINIQALYYTAEATSDGYLRLKTGGVCANPTPNYIEVTGGTAACLTAFGLTVGQSDTYTNTARPPRNKYYTASDMVVNIDVVSDDLNTRTELADLVAKFFQYEMEKRMFQFLGRSYFSEDIDPEEWFHIILNRQFAWSAELNNPRPGGPQYDHIFAKRGSVPITIIDFIDKELTTPPILLQSSDVTANSTVPTGDYGGDNYKRR
jgi:hypothetical protein